MKNLFKGLLDAAAGVTGVIWFNAAGTQIGTGSSIVKDINTSGLEDGADTFYYTATDAQGCPGKLCCPIDTRDDKGLLSYRKLL